MSARAFVAVFVVYTLVAITGLVFHLSVDPYGESWWLIAHIVNITLGLINIFRAVMLGVEYGWKS